MFKPDKLLLNDGGLLVEIISDKLRITKDNETINLTAHDWERIMEVLLNGGPKELFVKIFKKDQRR